jgi:hypothetical protein
MRCGCRISHQPELSGRPQSSPRSSSKPAQCIERIGVRGHVVPNLNIVAAVRGIRRALNRGAFFVHDHLGRRQVNVIVLFATGELRMRRLRLAPAVVGPFPRKPAFSRLRLEANLQRVVLVEMKVEFDLSRHLPQMHLHLLLQMRIAAQQRRQHLPGRSDFERADALLERERHERTRRALRQAIEAMLHAHQFKLGPRMVRLRREEQPHVLEWLAQTRGGDDFEIEIKP